MPNDTSPNDPYNLIVRAGQADLDEVLYRATDAGLAEDRLANLYAQGAISFEARDPKTHAPIGIDAGRFDALGLHDVVSVFTSAPGNRSLADAKQFLSQFNSVLREAGDFPVEVSVSATPFGFKKWVGSR